MKAFSDNNVRGGGGKGREGGGEGRRWHGPML